MYAVLGYGAQGRAIVRYLTENTEDLVRSYDPASLPSEEPARTVHDDRLFPTDRGFRSGQVLHMSDRWEHWELDHTRLFFPTHRPPVRPTVVISCLPPERNLGLARTCIDNGWSMIDLGGCETTAAAIAGLDSRAKEAGVSVVTDCGLAPGIVSSMASAAEEEGNASVRIFCGGIPRNPVLPLGYVRSFSVAGLIKEYTGSVPILRRGRFERIPALSEIEPVFVPGLGILEAAPTSGSLSTTPKRIASCYTLEYKTLRYPGHWDYVKRNILSQPDPEGVMKSILPQVGPDHPDVLALVVETDGLSRRFFWRFDERTGLSAMAQATGYTVASVATMIHEELLPPGVVHMDDIDPRIIVARAQKMPGQYMNELR